MDKITVSAPGKLVLMGEHSVVYDHSCLVLAIDKRITVTIEKSEKDEWSESKFITTAVKIFRETNQINQALKITVSSNFSASYGFGSSSAVTAGTAFGLFNLFAKEINSTRHSGEQSDSRIKKDGFWTSQNDGENINITKKELFDFCYQVVLQVQGVSSGLDVAAATYGGVLYFVTAGKVIEPINAGDFPLLVAYSGVKADTVTMVNQVKQQMTDHEAGVNEIFRNITNLVEEGKKALLEKDWPRLGTLMNFNQDYLEDLGVSTEKLDDMIVAAKKAGAYGAKLSGAGGGDCMIAVVSEEKRKNIEEAIKNVGGEILDVKISKEGVKIET